MTNVLHIVTNLYISGGIASWLLGALSKFPRDKFSHSIAHIGGETNPGREKDFKALGISIYNLPSFRNAPFKLFKLLTRIFQSNRFQILHTHHDWNGAFGTIIALFNKVPVRILYFHSGDPQHAGGFFRTTASHGFRLFGRFSATHLWFASSGNMHHWLGKSAKETEKVQVIKSGIPFYLELNLDPVKKRKELHLPEKGFLICHVGRMTYQKNHSTMLDALKILHVIYPETHLVFIGGGPLKQQILEKAKVLELNGNVHLLGERRDVPECLRAMDVFLFPSNYEPLGLAVLEAQDAGLPIVWSNVPGLREAVSPNWKNYGVAPNNPKMISEKLLAISSEPKYRPAEFLEHFSQEKAAERLMKAYEEALGGVGRST